MKYISVKEAANKWNVTERSVRNYCQNGKIIGAYITGKTWLIPENASKPGIKEEITSDEGEIGGLIKFLNESPVSFWAVDNAKKILQKAGYKELLEVENSKINKGDKIFFVRNGTSIVAMNIGKNITENNYPMHIIASHCDSPTFKVKPECDSITDIYNKVNTEPYGGLIRSTWLDRPLSIAGRVLIKQDNAIVSKLVNIDRDLLIIPNLCIHFNRTVNDGYSYNPATDLQPLMGQELGDESLKILLGEELVVDPNNIVNFDLYLYNREKATLLGKNRDYICSGRLDDLECVYTSIKAFSESNNDKAINICYISDNEEVGSSSRQGADSDFLSSVVNRVVSSLGFSNGSLSASIANSFMISADNAHAVHPNNPGITDSKNKCYMNKGIAIKFNAAQSYTSDAISASIFQQICENSGVLYQFFTNRSDLRGGGTLGNILLSHMSLLSVDIGLPQLAMHSSYETAGSKDVEYAINAFKKFYSSDINFRDNKIIIK